jgi:(4S)-4-hydroxy-5-phosphonooxypentane-2,3-dione isomerase
VNLRYEDRRTGTALHPAGNASIIVLLALTKVGQRLMLIVHVHIRVKPDQVEAFKAACIENSRNSLQEPGIARFDVLQQQDDPTRFLLVEVYRSAEAPAAHKQTAHYHEWAKAVADMMAVPRSSVKFDRVYPEGGLA